MNNRKEPSLFGAESENLNSKQTSSSSDKETLNTNLPKEPINKTNSVSSNASELEVQSAIAKLDKSSEAETTKSSQAKLFQENPFNKNADTSANTSNTKPDAEKGNGAYANSASSAYSTSASSTSSSKDFSSRQTNSKSADEQVRNPFVDSSSFKKESYKNFETKNPFDNSFETVNIKPAKKSGGSFVLVIFVAIAFLGLISLAFWQWETIQKNDAKIAKLTQSLEQISSDVSFIDQSSDSKAISLQESLNTMNKSISSLNAAMKKQNSASASNASKIASLSKSLSSDISKANSQINELSKNLNSAKNALDASINGLNAQVASLKNVDASLAKQIKGVANNIGEVSVVTDALSNKLNKINMKDIQDLKSARGQIEQELRSLTITTNRLTRQVEALLKANSK